MTAYNRDNSKDLAADIIRVIVFFDMFDHPVTVFEIWRELDRDISLSEVFGTLGAIVADSQPLLAMSSGFYFLAGRENLVRERQKRHNYSFRKIKIARRFAKFFSLLPYVRLVAVANSIGQYNLRDGSDIDFFLITSPRRIWLSRLYCTGLAKILNRRPNERDKRDKICLSFYLASDRLDISSLRLSGADPYFDHWRKSLVVLYNKKEIYQYFLQANGLAKPSNQVFAKLDSVSERSPFFNSLETVAKKLQLSIMPLELKMAMNNSDGVVVGDSILKLYLRDRRREYLEKYGNKIYEIFKEAD